MALTYWHNPRCSTSRKGLELLGAKGITPEIRLYLQDPPDATELAALGLAAETLIRWKDAEGLSRTLPEADLFAILAAEPRLIERPILTGPKGSRIGRPIEAMLEIL